MNSPSKFYPLPFSQTGPDLFRAGVVNRDMRLSYIKGYLEGVLAQLFAYIQDREYFLHNVQDKNGGSWGVLIDFPIANMQCLVEISSYPYVRVSIMYILNGELYKMVFVIDASQVASDEKGLCYSVLYKIGDNAVQTKQIDFVPQELSTWTLCQSFAELFRYSRKEKTMQNEKENQLFWEKQS